MLDLREYENFFDSKLKAENFPAMHLEVSRKNEIRWSFEDLEGRKYQCRIHYSNKTWDRLAVELRKYVKRERWIKELVKKNIDEEESIDDKLAEELIAKLIKKVKSVLKR